MRYLCSIYKVQGRGLSRAAPKVSVTSLKPRNNRYYVQFEYKLFPRRYSRRLICPERKIGAMVNVKIVESAFNRTRGGMYHMCK